VDADERIQKLLPERLEEAQARNRKEELAGLREREANDPLEVTGVADAGGGAEEEAGNGKGKWR